MKLLLLFCVVLQCLCGALATESTHKVVTPLPTPHLPASLSPIALTLISCHMLLVRSNTACTIGSWGLCIACKGTRSCSSLLL